MSRPGARPFRISEEEETFRDSIFRETPVTNWKRSGGGDGKSGQVDATICVTVSTFSKNCPSDQVVFNKEWGLKALIGFVYGYRLLRLLQVAKKKKLKQHIQLGTAPSNRAFPLLQGVQKAEKQSRCNIARPRRQLAMRSSSGKVPAGIWAPSPENYRHFSSRTERCFPGRLRTSTISICGPTSQFLHSSDPYRQAFYSLSVVVGAT